MTADERDNTKLERERAKQQRDRDAQSRRFIRWALAGGLLLLWVFYLLLNALDELPDLPQYTQAPFVLAVLILVISGYETGRGVQLERALEAAVTVDLAANNLLLRQIQEANETRLDTVKAAMREVERKHFAALDKLARDGIREIGERIDKAVERGVEDGALLAAREISSRGVVRRAGAEAGVEDITKRFVELAATVEQTLSSLKAVVADSYVEEASRAEGRVLPLPSSRRGDPKP